MKTYIKIMLVVIVLAALIILQPSGDNGIPDTSTPGPENETSAIPQVIANNDAKGIIGTREITFSNAYPNETAMYENVTWVKDVDKSESENAISQLTALREAEIQADAIAQKAEIFASIRPMSESGSYISLNEPRINKIERMGDYAKKWFPWKYFSGPSIANNSHKTGIYLKEYVISGNTTWIMDSEEEIATINKISVLNIRNIVAQHNSTELVNSTIFHSLDGTRYVLGPSKNREYGYGIYLKK